MRVRDRAYQVGLEERHLCEEAARSSASRGRDVPEEEDSLRPCYQRDQAARQQDSGLSRP